jgi:hypothetical protein
MPKEVSGQMGSQTKSMINTMSKVNDAGRIVKTAGNLSKEVANDVGKTAEASGDIITGVGYVAAPFTEGASLSLAPVGEGLSDLGKTMQGTVCLFNKDFNGAIDNGVGIGTHTVTSSLVNASVNQTIKVAGNITSKEVLTQKGVLGSIGKLWDKVVDFINQK